MLANEQVIDGRCWRHEDTIVEQRDLVQWFLRITAVCAGTAGRIWRSWMAGRRKSAPCSATGSAAAKAPRSICSGRSRVRPEKIRVFTTRVDTIFGATSVQLGSGACAGEGVCCG